MSSTPPFPLSPAPHTAVLGGENILCAPTSYLLGSLKYLFTIPTDFAYDLVPYLAEQTSTRLAVSLTSGLVAGVCAAIVSQPGEIFGLRLFRPSPGYV